MSEALQELAIVAFVTCRMSHSPTSLHAADAGDTESRRAKDFAVPSNWGYPAARYSCPAPHSSAAAATDGASLPEAGALSEAEGQAHTNAGEEAPAKGQAHTIEGEEASADDRGDDQGMALANGTFGVDYMFALADTVTGQVLSLP